MAIEVRIPTILRTYTGGAKTVEGAGDTLAALLADLDSRHSGLRGRLITEQGGLHRFVNIYVNDEDVRFLGSLDAKLSDGDNVTILPAVAGGAFGFAAAAALLGRSTSPLSRASGLDLRRPTDQAPQAALSRASGLDLRRPTDQAPQAALR